jgi:hypothetical protein
MYTLLVLLVLYIIYIQIYKDLLNVSSLIVLFCLEDLFVDKILII